MIVEMVRLPKSLLCCRLRLPGAVCKKFGGRNSPIGIAVVGATAQLLVFGKLLKADSLVVVVHACALRQVAQQLL
jgi:hypothetical protein